MRALALLSILFIVGCTNESELINKREMLLLNERLFRNELAIHELKQMVFSYQVNQDINNLKTKRGKCN